MKTFWITMLLVVGSACQAAADERYYVMIFGSESAPKRPRYTHTWAMMVRAVSNDAEPASYTVDSQTISWMPRTLNIRPLALRAECGVNLTLEATIRDCLNKHQCISMWGPYEYDPAIGPGLYERVAKQVARLESGCVLYKCIDPDTGPRAKFISNCIHAVTDLDPYLPRPSYNELLRNGKDASRFLVQILAGRQRFDTSVMHEWVAEAVGLGDELRQHIITAVP